MPKQIEILPSILSADMARFGEEIEKVKRGGARVILHVEAEPGLRGSGAAGRFMQSMAEHARENGLRLFPRCSYAVTWHKRHPDYDDVLA